MKKLISAATSLAMAASMASAVVPFATGAAALKTLEIRTLNSGASTTVDCSAGDVTIPIGIYVVEDKNTSDSISAQITVNSSNGDPSTVKFSAIVPGEDEYYDDNITVTGGDGGTYSLSQAVTFAGTFKSGTRGDTFKVLGNVAVSSDKSYPLGGTNNAFASTAWVVPNDGYTWAGTKSDSFPIVIVDVTFAQGTKAGTYTIDFLDYKSDDKNPDIKSCMIESSDVEGRKMTTDNGYLALGQSLTFTVGGSASTPDPTQAPVQPTEAPVQPTAAPVQPTAAPVQPTAAPGGQTAQPATRDQSGAAEWEKGTALDTFVIKSGELTIEAGKTGTLEVFAESAGTAVAQLVTRLNDRDLPVGLSVVGLGDEVSYAAKKAAVDTQGEFQYINTLDKEGAPQTLKDSEPIVQYDIKCDANMVNGTYDFSLSRGTVATSRDDCYEAKILPGKITVTGGVEPGGETPVPTQAPATEAPTSGGQPATKDPSGAAEWEKGAPLDSFIVKSGNWEVKPGETVLVEVFAESAGTAVAQLVTRLNDRDLPVGMTVVGLGDEVSYAAKKAAVDTQGEFQYINTLDKEGAPQTLKDEEPIVQYEVKVDSSVAPGTYDFALSRATVATSRDDCYEAKIVAGTIKVIPNGEVTPTEAPATEAPATEAPATEAPTSGEVTPTSALTPVYGDVNCDGKVNIADVVVLCAWNNDSSVYEMKDQNKVNADCCDQKAGAEINSNDADAIIQSIVGLVELPCTKDQLKSF